MVRIALELVDVLGVDSLNDHLESSIVELTFSARILAVVELTLLQPFTPDAVTTTVKVENLHLGLLAIDEDKQMT